LFIFVSWLNIKLKENDFEIDEQSKILRKIVIAEETLWDKFLKLFYKDTY
jgi:hypothetical protein